MYQQDFVMRQIEMAIGFVAKLLWGKSAPSGDFALELRANYGPLLSQLMAMIESGALGEAEDLLFQSLAPAELESLRLALTFYRELNRRSDDFLESNGFSRGEVARGLRDAAAVFGVDAPQLFYDEY